MGCSGLYQEAISCAIQEIFHFLLFLAKESTWKELVGEGGVLEEPTQPLPDGLKAF